jgi:hypothetical protein
MSENPRATTNNVVIALVVVVVLLVGGLGYVIWHNSQALPAPTATVNSSSNTAASTTATSSASTGAASLVPADFDAKSATKLPSGTTPEKWVDEYYAAADKGDWQTAFDHLPTLKQKDYATADGLKQQVASYGVVGYKITSATEQGDQATVTVDQETSQYGTFENTWIFQKSGSTWVVAGKAVTGMK